MIGSSDVVSVRHCCCYTLDMIGSENAPASDPSETRLKPGLGSVPLAAPAAARVSGPASGIGQRGTSA